MRSLGLLALVLLAGLVASCLYRRDQCSELHGDDAFEDRLVRCPSVLPFMCVQANGPTMCQATANTGIPGIQCAECSSDDGCVLEGAMDGPDVCVATANRDLDDKGLRRCVCRDFPQRVPCQSDRDCEFPDDTKLLCDKDTERCVSCLSDDDCDRGLVCDGGACVECATNANCPGSGLCDDHRCVQCLTDADCAAPSGSCSGGACTTFVN